MSAETDKAKPFLQRLISNPTFRGLNALQIEDQIVQFLTVNANQLYPALSSQDFFPGKDWQQVEAILLESLFEITNETLLPAVKKLWNERVNLAFIPVYRQQNVPVAKVKEQLFNFFINGIQKFEVRRAFTGAFTALYTGITDRYIDQIYHNHRYIHFELVKVQRLLKMDQEMVKDLIRITLFIRPLVYLSITPSNSGSADASAQMIQNQAAERALQSLRVALNLLPEQAVKSGVASNVSFEENSQLDATSRIAAVAAVRCKNYKNTLVVDRGAETLDKSWFNIARKNYRFYGFDIKLVEELYTTAAENGW